MNLINCKIHGFWRVLTVADKGRASLTNCKVDLTTAHTYPAEDMGAPVVSIMTCCCTLHIPLKCFSGAVVKQKIMLAAVQTAQTVDEECVHLSLQD
jgi:hypothetical protein